MPERFTYPNLCARCLGPPDGRLEYEQPKARKDAPASSRIEVPVCGACVRQAGAYRRRGLVLFVVASALGVAAALTLWVVSHALGAVWLAAIGVTVGSVLYTLDSWRAGFFGVEGGVPFFENPEYQRLFEAANGLERADYGAAAQQFLESQGVDIMPRAPEGPHQRTERDET